MNRRLLLILLAVAVALMAILFVSRGSGSSASPKPAPTARPNVHPKARPTPMVPKQVRQVRQYSVRLLPVVSRALGVFDAAVGKAASSGSSDALTASCSHSVQSVGVQSDYVEGVPHPYLWYSRAGLLHHELLGIYHDMEGAAVNCHTAASNGDDAESSVAVKDMSSAAKRLHGIARRLRAMARLPH